MCMPASAKETWLSLASIIHLLILRTLIGKLILAGAELTTGNTALKEMGAVLAPEESAFP